MGLSSNIFVQNALIHMSAANKKIENARQLFDEMPEKDLVSWNCLISGYSQNGCLRDVLALFQEMQPQNVLAHEITMGKVILACTHLGGWGIVRLMVEYIQKNSVKLDMFLCNTLIDMYGRCGCVDDAYKLFVEMSKRNNVSRNAMITACAMAADIAAARKLFDEMPERDLVSWTAMIAGYSQASEFSEALALFRQMLIENIKPDEMMNVYHRSPQMKHYGYMVDLLSRSGWLDEAYKFILKMPFDPDPVLWCTLLSACAVYGDVELAEITTKRFLVLESSNSDNCELLANVYARTGRWTDAMRIREKLKGSNLKKTPGCSSIEVNGVGYREQILKMDH
ncbi:hypothetical protein EJ110_NYTH39289 [Nymphaea thermarum]|nr:hypothetical protein EJ110_NYTH39289 [Nymphaea thermarum]